MTRRIRLVLFACVFPVPPGQAFWLPSKGRSSSSAERQQPLLQQKSLADDASQRWTGSGRWEASEGTGEQFLLKEKFGTYFKVPNPATLMTKIICTIGPSTADPETLGRMMDAGMSAARINMSHGSHEYATEIIDNVRTAAANRHRLCPIILDTKGPEIRVSWLPTGTTALELNSGEDVVLLTGKHSENAPKKPVEGQPTNHQVAVTYPYLARAVRQGDVVLLDDGRISLMVTRIQSEDAVHTTVIEGGLLKPNKGVNLPGCHVELPHLTEKDKQDILFGVSKKVEYVAHSFTRSATGINQVRELPGVVESGVNIIAKIESQEGLDNFASILRVSDGIMVARGDLGVEIPLERVCSVQKRLVASSNAVGKPVIVATELLDSMINHPRPTRAEASDVANAVFDGADCVMLSGETAVGKYPIEAIQVMNRICKEAELDVASSLRAMAATEGQLSVTGTASSNRWVVPTDDSFVSEGGALRDAFAKSAILAARETNADMIIAITRTGLTANALAKFFSSVPVMVVTTSPQVCAEVLLHRSVTPYLVTSLQRASCVPRAIAKAIELGLVSTGSRVLMLTGKDDMIANRLETFIVGEGHMPPLQSSTSSHHETTDSVNGTTLSTDQL
jgi:pyruvate kinase